MSMDEYEEAGEALGRLLIKSKYPRMVLFCLTIALCQMPKYFYSLEVLCMLHFNQWSKYFTLAQVIESFINLF